LNAPQFEAVERAGGWRSASIGGRPVFRVDVCRRFAMKKKPPRDPIAAFEREARATRRVGVGSRCVECGEGRPLALIPGTNPRICANCQREQLDGRLPFDDHHPAGEANDSTTIPTPVKHFGVSGFTQVFDGHSYC